MAGTALGDFNDFVEATGPTYVSGPTDLINEAVKNTYYFGRLARGDKNKKKTLRGGAEIRSSMIFRDNGSAETYLPGQNHNWKNPQRLQKAVADWRFTMAHMSWVEQEILLNETAMYGTDDAKFHQYVSLRDEKEMEMWTSKWNLMETNLWKAPVIADMETSSGTDPYSIPAFINEDTNGLFNPQASAAWTTVEGVDPTDADVDGRWAPQTGTYGTVAQDNIDNIIGTFDEMWLDVRFEQPTTHQQYFEDASLNNQMILTSKKGRAAYSTLLRGGQDRFIAGNQDPAYPDPQFHGIPVAYVSELDTAALYDSGSNTVVSEATADINGPRFYWVNGNYLYPVFHNERYFYKHEVTKHHNVPDTWVCPVATWYNVICTSRQRQGIVSPSTDLYY